MYTSMVPTNVKVEWLLESFQVVYWEYSEIYFGPYSIYLLVVISSPFPKMKEFLF